jgi:hypothetical protein
MPLRICIATLISVSFGLGGSPRVQETSAPTAARNERISEKDAQEIAREAYIYFYPLVTMDVTRLVSINTEPGKKPGFGPEGMFHHLRSYPTAEFREVVRPNFDTLYSMAWLDISTEPMILSVPDTGGRYYVLPIYDMWTDAYAALGSRTSGTEAANFAVVSPHWYGDLPAGVQRIEAPTNICWIIARTQTNGPADYDAVHKIQDGFKLARLSQWGKNSESMESKIDSSVDTKTSPLDQVNTMPAAKYFSYAAEIMKKNPPHLSDWSMVERLKRIGIVPGQSFDFASADPIVRSALEGAPAKGLQLMKAKLPTLARAVNGWQMNTDSIGVYGNYYLKRAIIALVGLGANSPEDAIYPLNIADAAGKPVNGANRYVLHFKREELPPVDAFWSITMYDSEGFQVANPINRFAIGDRDNLKYNSDGSLDIFIQHDRPAPDKESNWLPAPSGKLGITMRLYAPRAQAIDGGWAPPAIKQVT